MTEDTVESSVKGVPAALTLDTVPVGTPLDWPIVDRDGALLFEAGAILVGIEERKFLFDNFSPHRGDLSENAAASGEAALRAPETADPLTVKDMHLTIGALIGLRQQIGSAAPMHPSRIIGFAPNEALFATPPLFEGKILPLNLGENVEIVAIASQAVFRFVCTVVAVCQLPFDYIVLSKPGVIRRLRERKSIRVRAHLAVRYGIGETGESYEGLGLAKGISALGMSLAASWPLGQVGDRLRVAFALKSKDLDTPIETTAVIRNIQKGAAGEPAVHGLEFDQLDMAQQMAMKVFVFDRQDDVLYWTNPTR
ncbi:flagellar brake protein [Paraburkholderia phenazinium]|uniref:C-di-GMP-binding flagellar brake protein YcgR, contains PilZNR and PilZ domains n=1 Tax=Paraburkholderia phenazinium TaxID=60549 RepID=A0A1G8JAM0_9BURK|nr:flagellar brake protein [Paraburkholderia phenazinium]SDI28299.1 c-di-GMP-binding flagellar brake protein YcgR, contains PilZNR and PilZ domains [Paraburkholderia phenazinium]